MKRNVHYVKLVDYMGGQVGYHCASSWDDYIRVRLMNGEVKTVSRKHINPISEKEYNRIKNARS